MPRSHSVWRLNVEGLRWNLGRRTMLRSIKTHRFWCRVDQIAIVCCPWLYYCRIYQKRSFSTGAFGLWSDHVLPWWEHRRDPHILFLKYEDLKKVRFPAAVMHSSCKNRSYNLILRVWVKVEYKHFTYSPVACSGRRKRRRGRKAEQLVCLDLETDRFSYFRRRPKYWKRWRLRIQKWTIISD